MPSSSINRFKRLGPQLWELGDGGYLFIEDTVLELIGRYRQHAYSAPEAGGFLAGFYKGLDLHVVNLTVPQSRDRRSRFRFNRLDPKHVHQVTECGLESCKCHFKLYGVKGSDNLNPTF